MYLRGFAKWEGLPPVVQQQAELCEAGGGVPIIRYTAYDINRQGIPSGAYYGGCNYPPAPTQSAAPAQINVAVPTNVNTQVSPQVSPIFTQQDKPTNSPVNAGTTSTPQQSNSGAEFMEYLQQLEKTRAANDAEILKQLQQSAVSTPQPQYLQPQLESPPQPYDATTPETLPEKINKNILPVALAGAALLSILAFFKKRGK